MSNYNSVAPDKSSIVLLFFTKKIDFNFRYIIHNCFICRTRQIRKIKWRKFKINYWQQFPSSRHVIPRSLLKNAPNSKTLSKIIILGQRQGIIWAKQILLCTESEPLLQYKVSKCRKTIKI